MRSIGIFLPSLSDLEHRSEVFDRGVVQVGNFHPTCVIHEDVQPAEGLQSLLNELRSHLAILNVADNGDRLLIQIA